MLHVVVTAVCVISGFHIVLGLISVVVGIISSIKAEVWLAHSVSPIWSGGFVSIEFYLLSVSCPSANEFSAIYFLNIAQSS